MASIGWKGVKRPKDEGGGTTGEKTLRPFVSRLSSFKVFIFAGLLLLAADAAHACPMCTELIERGRDAFKNMKFAQGIALSMLLMFGMPLTIIGTFAFIIIRASRSHPDPPKVDCGSE